MRDIRYRASIITVVARIFHEERYKEEIACGNDYAVRKSNEAFPR